MKKKIAYQFLKEIEAAYNNDVAASINWAQVKVEEIRNFLLVDKNELEVTFCTGTTVLNNFILFCEWLALSGIKIPCKENTLDRRRIVENLNTTISRLNIDTIAISEDKSDSFKKKNLHFDLFSKKAYTFYVGFKDVSYTSHLIDKNITIKNMKFKNDYGDTYIKKSDTFFQSICIVIECLTMDSKKKAITIICRNIEL